MKTLRKSMLLILAAVFSLSIALFAAACGGKKVTLSFVWEDSAVVNIETTPGEKIELPADYDREGYFFMGWFADSNYSGTKYEDSITAPEKDTTYYARWVKGYTITLESEGTLEGGSSVLVPEGGNILEYLQGYSASMSGLTFGAWFNGDKEITSSDVMPAQNLTLTAKFKADYTVKVFTQKEAHKAEYEESAELSYTGKEYVGKELNLADTKIPNYVINHNYKNETAQTVEKLTISKTASENVFTLYCDREEYTIIYDSNAPDGAMVIGKMADQHFVYGETAKAHPNGFSIEGYLFAGWSTEKSGTIKYLPDATLDNGSVTLYAIWDMGYADMFGGTDYIYFPRLEPDVVVLMRASHRIEGTFDRGASIATFLNGTLKAKILGDRFAYYNEDRNAEFKLYNGYLDGEGVSQDTVLKINGYFDVTLGNSTGTIAYDAANGYYELNVDGRVRNVLLSEYDGQKVFMYIGSETGTFRAYERKNPTLYSGTEYEFTLDGVGGIVRVNLATGVRMRGSYKQPDMSTEYVLVSSEFAGEEDVEFLLYNGFCLLKNQTQSGTFNAKDNGSGTVYLDGYNGMMGCYYEPESGNSIRCTYYIETTILGDVAHLTPEVGGDEYTFILSYGEGENAKTFEKVATFNAYRMIVGAMVDGSFTNQFTPYVLILTQEKYEEAGAPDGAVKASLYYDDSVSNASETVTVELYKGYAIDNTASYMEPLSSFTMTQDLTEQAKQEHEGLQVDMPYTKFQFHTSDVLSAGNVFYTYGEATVKGDDGIEKTEKDYMVYHEEGGNQGELLIGSLNAAPGYGAEGLGSFYKTSTGYLEGGLSIYYAQGLDIVEFGVSGYLLFQVRDPVSFTLTDYYYAAYGDLQSSTANVRIVLLNEAPKFLTRIYDTVTTDNNSLVDDYASLRLDGLGNATYYRTKSEADDHTGKVQGLYNLIRTVTIGDREEELYMFTSDELSFSFVLSSTLDGYYNMESSVLSAGTYNLTNGDTLELDGFGAYARYTDKYDKVVEGLYMFQDDGTTQLIFIYQISQRGEVQTLMMFSVEMTETETEIAALTFETQAQYWLMVNSSYELYFGEDQQVIISFTEGKNVRLYEALADGSTKLYASGSYDALAEEGRYIIDIWIDATSQNRKWTVQLGVIQQYGNQQVPICVVEEEGVSGSYLSTDSAVLNFDGFGDGYLVTKDGYRFDGSYTFLDDTYAVFEDDGLEIYVVKYDKTARTFEIVNHDETKYVTYYAADMTAVEFAEVLRINGEAVAYWFFEGENPVYYVQGANGWEKKDEIPYKWSNEETYTVEFGTDDNKTSVTYYRWHAGDEYTLTGSISFDAFNQEAQENGKKSGKLENATLKFKPDGTSELNAPATFSFKDGDDTVTGNYTVVMSFARTSAENTLHFAYLQFGDLQLRLEVNRNGEDKKSGTFTVHAEVSSDVVFLDYIGENGGRKTGTVHAGYYYTVGMRKWLLTEWDKEVTMLLSGRVNIFDNGGQYIHFEKSYDDVINNKDAQVTTDSTYGAPVYRILTTGSDGVQYSLNLEFISTGSYYVFIPYSICVYKEIEEDNVKYTVEQFITSYQTEDYPFLGVYTCEVEIEDEEGETIDLLADYKVGIWDTNVVLCEYDGEDKEHADKPDYYVVWFDLDTNNHVTKGYYKEGSSLTVTGGNDNKFTFEGIVVYGEDDSNIEGFIPLTIKTKDAAGAEKEIVILTWKYNDEEEKFSILYTLDENSYDYKALTVIISGTKESATATVTEVKAEEEFKELFAPAE